MSLLPRPGTGRHLGEVEQAGIQFDAQAAEVDAPADENQLLATIANLNVPLDHQRAVLLFLRSGLIG
ncbi:hypothetical protein ACHT8Q_06410 [Stutzerimonas degradans]